MFDEADEAIFRGILLGTDKAAAETVQENVNAIALPSAMLDFRQSITSKLPNPASYVTEEWEEPLSKAFDEEETKLRSEIGNIEETKKSVLDPRNVRLNKNQVEQLIARLNEAKTPIESKLNEMDFSSTSWQKDFSRVIDQVANDFKTAATQVAEAKNNSVVMVKEVLEGIKRPPDVSCSISVLPWDVAHDDYGRHLANKMIAVQVTIRNLNKTDEFLVHDVQIAVDTFPGQLNRFQTGVNQPALRGIVSIGQDISLRSWTVRLAEFVGTIAASGSIPGSSDFKNGVAVYTGAFVPALKGLLPDHTVEQIGRLDEMAFSANNTRRVVVPIRSSVMVVTFIPSQPLEMIDFDCMYRIQAMGQAAADQCEENKNKGDGSGASPTLTTYLRKKRKHYKSWSPLDLLALQNSAYVIVAGVHVKEEASVPTLQSLSCEPKTSDGKLDVAQAKDPVKCQLTGDQVQLVKTIVLKNTANLADPATATGTITLKGGDTKNADVTFKLDDIKNLKANDYTVFFPDANGITKSSTVHLALKPAEQKSTTPEAKGQIKPDTVDLATVKSGEFVLTDVSLKAEDKVELLDKDGKVVISAQVKAIDEAKKSATVEFPIADLKSKLQKGGEFTVGLVSKGGAEDKPQTTNLKITVKAAGNRTGGGTGTTGPRKPPPASPGTTPQPNPSPKTNGTPKPAKKGTPH